MDRFLLNPKDDKVRGQEIRLSAMDLAVRAYGLMGRSDPVSVAKDFEAYIVGGVEPAQPELGVTVQVAQAGEAGDGISSQSTDMIEVIEPPASKGADSKGPASLRQADKAK